MRGSEIICRADSQQVRTAVIDPRDYCTAALAVHANKCVRGFDYTKCVRVFVQKTSLASCCMFRREKLFFC